MQRAGNLLLAVFSGLVMWTAYGLGLGALSRPGAGTWSFLVGGVMLVLSLLLLITERTAEDYEPITRRTGLVVLGIGSLAAYVVAFSIVGFLIPTFVSLIFWLRFMAKEPWRLTVLLGTVITAACYGLFVHLLGVPFPEGPIELFLRDGGLT